MIAESINEVKYPQLNIKVEDSLKKKVEKRGVQNQAHPLNKI